VVNTKDKIRTELNKLILYGLEILSNESTHRTMQKSGEVTPDELLEFNYEKWYTKSLNVLQQLAPERIKDFQQLYKLERRKDAVDFATYTISDYLIGLRVHRGSVAIIGDSQAFQAFAIKFRNQIGIISSLIDSLDSILYNIQGVLQAELFDTELEAAEELLKNGHIRSSGVLAGVSLEAHLETICNKHSVKITKKNPTISTYNDELKDASVYDIPQWRFIQHLGDLRNKCAHKGTNEPTKQDAQDLIDGVKKVIKTVF
jgi:hypothetical protein